MVSLLTLCAGPAGAVLATASLVTEPDAEIPSSSHQCFAAATHYAVGIAPFSEASSSGGAEPALGQSKSSQRSKEAAIQPLSIPLMHPVSALDPASSQALAALSPPSPSLKRPSPPASSIPSSTLSVSPSVCPSLLSSSIPTPAIPGDVQFWQVHRVLSEAAACAEIRSQLGILQARHAQLELEHEARLLGVLGRARQDADKKWEEAELEKKELRTQIEALFAYQKEAAGLKDEVAGVQREKEEVEQRLDSQKKKQKLDIEMVGEAHRLETSQLQAIQAKRESEFQLLSEELAQCRNALSEEQRKHRDSRERSLFKRVLRRPRHAPHTSRVVPLNCFLGCVLFALRAMAVCRAQDAKIKVLMQTLAELRPSTLGR